MASVESAVIPHPPFPSGIVLIVLFGWIVLCISRHTNVKEQRYVNNFKFRFDFLYYTVRMMRKRNCGWLDRPCRSARALSLSCTHNHRDSPLTSLVVSRIITEITEPPGEMLTNKQAFGGSNRRPYSVSAISINVGNGCQLSTSHLPKGAMVMVG